MEMPVSPTSCEHREYVREKLNELTAELTAGKAKDVVVAWAMQEYGNSFVAGTEF